MKMWSFEFAGAIHMKNGVACQDAAKCGEIKEMRYVVLADGAGSKRYSKAGAECAVTSIVNYMSDNFDRILIENPIKAKYIILSDILYHLKDAADTHDIKEFGSTILFVGVKDDRYILFHLGDGIIAADRDCSCKIISQPMNGINKKYTYLTTTQDAYKRARFIRGINLYDDFILASDGIYDVAVNDGCFNKDFIKIMQQGQKDKTIEFLQSKGEITDDYSLSYMSLR